jgi:hypothetical protein
MGRASVVAAGDDLPSTGPLTFVTKIRQTIFPDPASRDGPLPPLLVTLTGGGGL